MGIYDRDYYRREGPSFLGSISRGAQVCKWLIGINLAVFIVQLSNLESGGGFGPVTQALWLRSDLILEGQVWRLLTYAFLHSISPWHILFNMLFLWWFGHVLEEKYGSREFLTMYLVAAFLSGFAQFLFTLNNPIPALGASGAVTAVMVIFAFHFPHHKILLWFFIPVPIWLLVTIQVAQDTFVLAGGRDTGVAVACHLGGALFGFLYFQNQWRLSNLWIGLAEWRKRRSRPRLRVYREETRAPVGVSAAKKDSQIDEHLEAKLDAVLEKISREGRENLTDEERAILIKASEYVSKKRT